MMNPFDEGAAVVLPPPMSARRNSGANNSVLSMTIENKNPHVIDMEQPNVNVNISNNYSALDDTKKEIKKV